MSIRQCLLSMAMIVAVSLCVLASLLSAVALASPVCKAPCVSGRNGGTECVADGVACTSDTAGENCDGTLILCTCQASGNVRETCDCRK